MAGYAATTSNSMEIGTGIDVFSRSAHKCNGPSEEQVCTFKLHVTSRHGPVEDLMLHPWSEGYEQARKILCPSDSSCRASQHSAEQARKILGPSDSSCGASQHSAKVPAQVDLESSDSPHNEKAGQSYEATKPLNKSEGDGSTGTKECYFFWVDNLDEDGEPHKIVNFLKRELHVSSHVALYPNLFLDNTCSGAIYVESKIHASRVLKLLRNPNSIIVSLKGRPWVFNGKCCGIVHFPMPWQEMNLEPENQDDTSDIRVLHPWSEGYEQARKILDLSRAHCEHVERLKQNLRSEELKLSNALPNRSQSRPCTSK